MIFNELVKEGGHPGRPFFVKGRLDFVFEKTAPPMILANSIQSFSTHKPCYSRGMLTCGLNSKGGPGAA